MISFTNVLIRFLIRSYEFVRSRNIVASVTKRFLNSQLNKIQKIEHPQPEFKGLFYVPNPILKYRADTFSTKEPDTLKWIDSMPSGAVLWDIGANVGLYSIYAAKVAQARVLAFEPSIFNLEWLVRNIHLNKLQKKISVVPLALSDKCGFNMFSMSNTTWGGALSTFGEKFDQNGADLKIIFDYETIGLTLAAAYQCFSLPKPTHIKIDVDGLEHFILRGAGDVLSYPQQILIEINDTFVSQARETSDILKVAGLRLESKFGLGVPHQYNQLWCR